MPATIQSNVAVNIPNPIIFDNNNLNPFIGTTQSGAINLPITSYQVNNSIAFGDAGTNVGNLLLGAPSLTFSGPVSVTGGITLDSETPNATEFTGQITGQGGFTISSSGLATSATTGAIIFSGPNTFTGGIDVVGGSSGINANGAITTLGIGSGSSTVINSSGQLISGPFGTGTLSFYNNQAERQPDRISGTTTTALQVPDDGGNYVLGNHIYLDDQTTFQVGATNPNTTLDAGGRPPTGGLDGSFDPTASPADHDRRRYATILRATRTSLEQDGPRDAQASGCRRPLGFTNINSGSLIMNGAGDRAADGVHGQQRRDAGDRQHRAERASTGWPRHGPAPTRRRR